MTSRALARCGNTITRLMMQDATTYNVWIGGSCDYGHKERAGGAAVVIEQNGNIICKDVITDLHTTEFFLHCAMKASKGRAPDDANSHDKSDERTA